MKGLLVSSVKFLMITYCVLMTVLLAAPLLVLTPKLAELKRSGLHKYAGLGTAYVKSFDAKWIRRLSPEQEPLLGTADIQSLADLYNSYTVVREMNVVLVDKKVLIGLTIPSVLPFIPLLIIATPANTLIHGVMKLLV